ncbi:acid protease [Coniochaeta ligniaria NRRL 30616]|uniref:Acid protease n=1 Tax=Coniochaeta ligniaria NRRL 30616 TaxID=1408157 RepID=A0A1J7JGB7_9PEZI|nr:acid protease [Coniochaeta ligniaria NRRL 30616]
MSSTLLYLAAAVFPAVSHALLSDVVIPRDNPNVEAANFIRYPVVPLVGGSVFGKHSRRQEDVSALGQRSGTIYTINIVLGTPGVSVPVQFDTGASELWVNPVCSKATDQAFCAAQPRFTVSSTLIDLGTQGYNDIIRGPAGDYTGYVNFEYVADYMRIGSARITQQIFGAAYDSVRPAVGILGAAPDISGWSSPYPFVIDSLRDQGFTNSRAFSMDLQGLESTDGSVIFGGVDTKKYAGSLIKLPIVPAAQSPDGTTRFYIHLDGISVNQPDGTVVSVYQKPAGGVGQAYKVDSGYTLSALPSDAFSSLVAAFPSAQAVDSDLYSVDCLDPGQGGSLDFTFGDKVINVPYNDFVWHDPRSGLCILGAFQDDYVPVLGETFLRAAYVVFDWDNQNIHLAQSADCGSNVIAIGSGADAVPSVAGGCAVVLPTSTSSSTTVSSTSTTETSSTTSEASTSTTESSSTTSEASTSTTESSSTTSEVSTSTTEPPSTTSETSTSTEETSSTTTEVSTTSDSSSSSSVTSTSDSSSSSSTESSAATSTTEASSSSSTEQSTITSTTESSSSSTESTTVTSTTESSSSSSTESSDDACTFEPDTSSSSDSSTVAASTDSSVTTSSSMSSSVDPTDVSSSSVVSSDSSTATSSTSEFSSVSSSASSTSSGPGTAASTSVTSSTASSSAASSVAPITTVIGSSGGSGLTSTITYTTTSVYTITSCAPGKTACRPGAVTTATITSVTTFCPEASSTSPPTISKSTLTSTRTTTYTITSCAPEKTACHPGQVTTEVVTALTTVCPQTTGTYTLQNVPVTVVPIVAGTPVVVPGCTPGAPTPTGLASSSGGSTGVVVKPSSEGHPAVSTPLSGGSAATTTQTVSRTTAAAASVQWTTTSGANATAIFTAKATPSVVMAGVGRTSVVPALAALVVAAGMAAVGL